MARSGLAARRSTSSSLAVAGGSGGSLYVIANTCRRAPLIGAVAMPGWRAERKARSGSVATPSPAATSACTAM